VLIDVAQTKSLIWDANDYMCTELNEATSMTSIQCRITTNTGKGNENKFGRMLRVWKEWHGGKVLTNSLDVNNGGLEGHVR